MKEKQNIDDLTPPGASQLAGPAEQRATKRESTRSYIALIYVIAYLAIVAAALSISTLKEYSIQDNKDLLLAISGILSGPLGFIIGYYFKASSEK